jgi:hypothetical protein
MVPNRAFGVGGDAMVFPEEDDNTGEDLSFKEVVCSKEKHAGRLPLLRLRFEVLPAWNFDFTRYQSWSERRSLSSASTASSGNEPISK